MAIIPKKIGTKKIEVVPEERGLNKWVVRPPCTENTLPLKSALNVSTSNVSLERLSKGSIGYIGCFRNDVQQAQNLFVLSSCFGDGHGYSIDPSLIDRTFILWASMKIVDHSWSNDRDQFQQPNCELPEDFITDCAVWCLYHGSNQTSALKDVEYKGTKWQVRNQFYPYSVEWLRSLESMPQEVYSQLRSAKDTYVSTWLSGRTLSTEAQALLDAGRKVYEVFYKEYANLNRTKYKLSYWDAGWYQIRNALLDAGKGLVELNDVKMAHNTLRAKLRPKVYEYGFLSPEIIYE